MGYGTIYVTQETLGGSKCIRAQTLQHILHRGRAMLRSWLVARVGAEAKNAFPFMGVRCDRVFRGVFLRLAELATEHP